MLLQGFGFFFTEFVLNFLNCFTVLKREKGLVCLKVSKVLEGRCCSLRTDSRGYKG